jgi:hypothetical protein
MKHPKLMAIVSLLMVALGTASAQSLGDYARTARKNKAEPSPTARHFDNDNLPTTDTLSVVGPSPATSPAANSAATAANSAASPAASVPAEASKANEQKAAVDRQKAADDMNKKIQEQQDKINSLNREIDLDQREQRLRAASYYTDAGTRLRNPAQWDKDQSQNANDASEKSKTLDAARQQLEQMQEEARKAGIAKKEKDKDKDADSKQ